MPHLGYHSMWSNKKEMCRSRTTRHILSVEAHMDKQNPSFPRDTPHRSLLQRPDPWIPFYPTSHIYILTRTLPASLLCTITLITVTHTDSCTLLLTHTYTIPQTITLNSSLYNYRMNKSQRKKTCNSSIIYYRLRYKIRHFVEFAHIYVYVNVCGPA